MTDSAALNVHVFGRVQMVGFRAWTQAEARRRGLRGWVKNEADGSVSLVVTGPEAPVAAFLAALRDGPRAARVTDVRIAEVADAPDLSDFEIRR